MNIKVFNIRLSKEYCENDQESMNAFLELVEVKLSATNFVTTSSVDYWSVVVFYLPKKNKEPSQEQSSVASKLSNQETVVYNALRQWRNDCAQQLDWSPFRICHNSHLISIAKANPQTLEELEQVIGFGSVRAQKYGKAILAIIQTL